MALALLGGAARAVGGQMAKSGGRAMAKKVMSRGDKKQNKSVSRGSAQQSGGRSGALTVRPKTTLIPASTMKSSGSKTPDVAGVSGGNILQSIYNSVVQIDKILKGTLAEEKALTKEKTKQDKREDRDKREGKLEKKKTKEEKKEKGLSLPKLSFFDRIKKFITTIIAGFILQKLVALGPEKLEGIIKAISGGIDFVADSIIAIVDAAGTFLLWGQKVIDGSKDWLRKNRGDEAVERFNKLLGSLGNLFNATIIVGALAAKLGGGNKRKPGQGPGQRPGRKPGPRVKPDKKTRTRRASQAARKRYARRYGADAARQRFAGQTRGPMKGGLGRRGLEKAPGRLGVKLFGKQGVKLVSKTFGKIPVMGPLIVAVASLLAGEPIGQAVFKGLGAALGGLLGSFIPIPVIGTILGETIGVLVGDMMYSLILGGGAAEAGAKFMTALKTALDVGGLIVNFFKEGFGRFFKDFPTVDVPNFLPFDAIPKAIATVFPFFDKDKDGKVGKMPNLSILFNPVAMLTELIPHAAASFLPDIFGKDGTAFGESKKAPDNKSTGGTGGDASAAMPSVSTQGAGLRNQTEGSKIAGELGRYLNREGLKWGSGVTEHPEHGGVKPVHTDGSYHYKEQGYRAIDIGGWGPNRFKREGQTGTDDQTQIIAGIQKFNKDKGVKPIEFITEATDPTYHNDHVHIAYGLGGLVRGLTHAMLGENGKEFVIDNDSYTAIEGAFPGLLAAANAAKGKSAIEAVMAYTDYEKPPEPEMAMMGGGSGGGSGSYGDGGESGIVSPSVPEGSSGTNSGWKDIRYKFG